MKERNIIAVVALSVLTFGIYLVVWTIKSKNEMNQRGAGIPSAWLLLVPVANIWWVWRFCQGIEFVTSGRLSAAVAFLLMWMLPGLGQAIAQDAFNKVAQTGSPAIAV